MPRSRQASQMVSPEHFIFRERQKWQLFLSVRRGLGGDMLAIDDDADVVCIMMMT